MPTVALASEFLDAFARIPRAQQKKVRDFTEKFKANPIPRHQLREDPRCPGRQGAHGPDRPALSGRRAGVRGEGAFPALRGRNSGQRSTRGNGLGIAQPVHAVGWPLNGGVAIIAVAVGRSATSLSFPVLRSLALR